MMAKIISIGSFQGRSGSTTLAANIGYALATGEKYQKKVLLIDLNPNMGLTEHLLFNHWKIEEFKSFDKKKLKEDAEKEKISETLKENEIKGKIESKVNLYYFITKQKHLIP